MAEAAPYNIEVEQAIIGSLLLDGSAIGRTVEIELEPDHFYIVKNGWIYDAAVALYRQGEPVDFMTITTELERRGQMEEIGGAAYLSKMIEVVPTALHVEAYARIVQNTARRRMIIAAAGEMAALAIDEQTPVQDVIEQAEASIYSVAQSGRGKKLEHIRRGLSSLYERVTEMQQGIKPGIPTKLTDLDKLLGGLFRSDLLLVASRPGMGKTTFLLDLAMNVAWGGKKVGIFSLEMSEAQLLERMVAAQARISSHSLRLGQLADDEWPKFADAAGKLSELGIYVDDTPGLSPLMLKSKARQRAMTDGLDLIIVDYIQLMTTSVRKENRHQELGYIAKALKGLAKELNVPVVAASQLNRGLESRADKRPTLGDLRDSGSLEEDADVVIFIYRDEVYNPETELTNIAELIVSKHRHGPTGTVSLFFNKAHGLFQDAEVYSRDFGTQYLE